jgi:hypothetical protein
VPDAADADHDRGRARGQAGEELLDGVVGGNAGVGMRSDLGGVDTGRQLDQRAFVDEHVVGEAAVARQAGELVALAVHVDAAAAGDAETAAVRGVDEDCIAGRGGGDVVADRLYPARVLVAEDDRRLQARRLHQAFLRVQVGRAHAGAADLHDHVPRRDRLRLGALDQLERLVVLRQKRCSHAARWSASRVASAMIVSEGLTESVRGISELSPT